MHKHLNNNNKLEIMHLYQRLGSLIVIYNTFISYKEASIVYSHFYYSIFFYILEIWKGLHYKTLKNQNPPFLRYKI